MSNKASRELQAILDAAAYRVRRWPEWMQRQEHRFVGLRWPVGNGPRPKNPPKKVRRGRR